MLHPSRTGHSNHERRTNVALTSHARGRSRPIFVVSALSSTPLSGATVNSMGLNHTAGVRLVRLQDIAYIGLERSTLPAHRLCLRTLTAADRPQPQALRPRWTGVRAGFLLWSS